MSGPSYKKPRASKPLPEAFEAIVQAAPDVPGYGGGKWAMYGIGCCWWTSRPKDLGSTGGHMPCCPWCGSMLFQAPLREFLTEGIAKPDHYGRGGLATFLSAHNSPCCRTWDEYEVPA